MQVYAGGVGEEKPVLTLHEHTVVAGGRKQNIRQKRVTSAAASVFFFA